MIKNVCRARRLGWLMLALALNACQAEDKPQGKGPRGQRGPVAVEVSPIELGVISGQRRYVGELRAPESVELASKVAGRLQQVSVQMGAQVKAGQLLARIDDAEHRAQQEEAQSALAVAQASVQRAAVEDKSAAQELARKQPLAEQDLLTRQELDNVRTRRDAAAAQLMLARAQAQQAQARLKLIGQQLADARVLAPFAGWVEKRYLDPGAVLSPGTPVLRLVRTHPILLRFQVPEREVGALRKHLDTAELSVQAELDAYPGETLQAKIARVAPAIDASSRSAAVEATLDNEAGRLMPGMYGRVIMSLAPGERRPLLPLVALVERETQQSASGASSNQVFVVLAGKAKLRSVRLGRDDGERGEVLEGLQAGDAVVIAGHSTLRDGAEVQVVAGAAPPEVGAKGQARAKGSTP